MFIVDNQQLRMFARNRDAKPYERQYRIRKPVFPAQEFRNAAIIVVKIHPDVEKFMKAKAGNVVDSEPLYLEYRCRTNPRIARSASVFGANVSRRKYFEATGSEPISDLSRVILSVLEASLKF